MMHHHLDSTKLLKGAADTVMLGVLFMGGGELVQGHKNTSAIKVLKRAFHGVSFLFAGWYFWLPTIRRESFFRSFLQDDSSSGRRGRLPTGSHTNKRYDVIPSGKVVSLIGEVVRRYDRRSERYAVVLKDKDVKFVATHDC
jgi:hypothetical protein